MTILEVVQNALLVIQEEGLCGGIAEDMCDDLKLTISRLLEKLPEAAREVL
jgi:hypothetical protein